MTTHEELQARGVAAIKAAMKEWREICVEADTITMLTVADFRRRMDAAIAEQKRLGIAEMADGMSAPSENYNA